MMKIAFWLSFGLIIFTYFIYPFIIAILARLKGKKINKDNKDMVYPFISLIIPVHNEEAVIREKVKNILELDYPKHKLEILFALDGCSDNTKGILLEYKDKGIEVLDKTLREGKVETLNKAVAKAKGGILVFSDANSIYEKDALRKLVRWFCEENVGCVCGRLKYLDAGSNSVGNGESLYWRYEHFIKQQESKLGKLLVTNGSIQAVRKKLYPYPDPDIADDFSIPILIQSKGFKVIYEPEAVVREAATKCFYEQISQKARIILQGFKGTARLRKDILKLGPVGLFEFFFHKLLRWLIPLFMLLILISNFFLIKNTFYLYLFFAQSIFYLLGFLGFIVKDKNNFKIFYIPFYFCSVNFASLLAIYWLFKGKQSKTWNKALTTRLKGDEKLKVV